MKAGEGRDVSLAGAKPQRVKHTAVGVEVKLSVEKKAA